ncbi:MAG: tetratricopeptide repeat protein [Alkalispirochaeta sp.]
MSDSSTHSPAFTERLTSFLSRFRKVLIFGGIAVLVAIIAAVVVAQVMSARNDASIRAAEELQELWDDYDADSEDASVAQEDVREAVSQLIDEYPRTYGALRARMILAELEWQLENWEAAQDAYMAVVDEHGRNHLTGPALFSAAAAAEEAGNLDRARELYGRVADGEGDPTTEVPHALFNLGRIAELQSDQALAIEYYNRLIDDHSSSNWTNLGRNRIIWLTSQGAGADS